jgi:hypothetical protein
MLPGTEKQSLRKMAPYKAFDEADFTFAEGVVGKKC